MKMKRWMTLALSGVLVAGTLGYGSAPVKADEAYSTDYVITIPSTLDVANKGWNGTDGITAKLGSGTAFDTGKKLTVTAASTNNWALKSGENAVGYNLATAGDDNSAYNAQAEVPSWEFAADEITTAGKNKGMGIIVEDYSTKPAGTYQDTVTFTAKVESAVVATHATWKLTLSSPAKELCIIANGGVIAQHTLDVASTEFTVEMPELTSQTVNIFATDGSGNCWYCTQENMSFAIGQTYQSSPTMTALGTESSADVYKMTGAGTIPDGKTVVLSGVTISGGSITCSGNANIILLGSNSVTATTNEKAAIKIGGSGTTLTITGSGSLTAQGGKSAAGIGTDRNESGGNIVINGGTVTATGGNFGAGIGTGRAQGASITCGDITINGGTVTATGGSNGGAGIGTGLSITSGGSNTCGAITIGTGVTMVTATKGSGAPNSIGNGQADFGGTQTCGTITIGGDATTYAAGVTESPFTYPTAP